MKRIMPSKDKFIEIFNESTSISDIARKLGYTLKQNKCPGGVHKIIKSKIWELGLNYSDLDNRRNNHYFNKGHQACLKQKPLESYFHQGSKYNNQVLLKKLVQNNIKRYECEICGLGKLWNNKIIVLELHHINGIFNDNRIENLQIICPNCHSQTRNSKKSLSGLKFKLQLPLSYQNGTNANWRKRPRLDKRKVERPDKETLIKTVNELGFSATGRKFGVSDNAIRKWLKNYDEGVA